MQIKILRLVLVFQSNLFPGPFYRIHRSFYKDIFLVHGDVYTHAAEMDKYLEEV